MNIDDIVNSIHLKLTKHERKQWKHEVRARKSFNDLYLNEWGVNMAHPKVWFIDVVHHEEMYSLYAHGWDDGYYYRYDYK